MSKDRLVPPPMHWHVHLYAQQRDKALPLICGSLAGSVLVGYSLHQAILGVLAFILLFMSTRDYWLPVRYWLDENGAHMSTFLARYDIAWSRVKYISATDDGRLRLSSVPRTSRLAPFRGVELRMPSDRQQVMQAIKQWRESCGSKTPS